MVERDDIRPTSPSLVSQLAPALRRRWNARVPSEAGWWKRALLILAATPLASAATIEAAALIQQIRNARFEHVLAPQLERQEKVLAFNLARARIEPLVTGPTISDVAERLAVRLPDDARLQLLQRDGQGRIRIEIDCPDPDRLRDALAPDALLGRWQMTGQGVTSGEGLRVTLASPAP
jgi:hypothetical protein